MAKLYKDSLEIETDLPSEIVALKSQGFSATKPTKAAADETSRAEGAKPAPKSTK